MSATTGSREFARNTRSKAAVCTQDAGGNVLAAYDYIFGLFGLRNRVVDHQGAVHAYPYGSLNRLVGAHQPGQHACGRAAVHLRRGGQSADDGIDRHSGI